MKAWSRLVPFMAAMLIAGCASQFPESKSPSPASVTDAQRQSVASNGTESTKPDNTDSSVTMRLKSGANTVVTKVIKPDETASIPKGTIGAWLHFPEGIDWYSVKLRVEGNGWHGERKNRIPNDHEFYFAIRPDMGAENEVKVIVEEANNQSGKQLLDRPIEFRIQTSENG